MQVNSALLTVPDIVVDTDTMDCTLFLDIPFLASEQDGASMMRREWTVSCPGGCDDTEVVQAAIEVRHTPVVTG